MTTKETSIDKCRKSLYNNGSTVWIFSDKKNWNVDQGRNSRNDSYLACYVQEVSTIGTIKHTALITMMGVVASDGKQMATILVLQGDQD